MSAESSPSKTTSKASELGTEVHTQPSHGFIVTQLFGDLRYLTGERDFLLVISGLNFTPVVFNNAFRTENAELTERWGHSSFADRFFEPGEIIGEAAIPVSASVLAWSTGKLFGNSRLQSFGSDLLRAQAVNGLVTGLMKAAVNRNRPDGAPYSYPSGHTSSAFATAGVVYRHFGKVWGTAAFVLATHVGLSRLQENKHYLSDVIAGGVLGSYVSLKLAGRDGRESHVVLTPQYSDKHFGLRASVRL